MIYESCLLHVVCSQTQDALRKALEAAKEVTEYAKERDATARRLEAQLDSNVRDVLCFLSFFLFYLFSSYR